MEVFSAPHLYNQANNRTYKHTLPVSEGFRGRGIPIGRHSFIQYMTFPGTERHKYIKGEIQMKTGFRVMALLMVTVLMLTTCGMAALADDAVTLTLWCCYNDADETDNSGAQLIKGTVAKFEETHPNVKIDVINTADGDDYLTKVTAELSAGKVPDLFRTWLTGRLQPFVEGGYVMPLNDLVAGSEILSKHVTEASKGYSSYGDEKFYAIPLIASAEIVYYNKAIFEECGVTVPTTMDEFYTVCETIAAKGITPIAMGGADAWFSAIPFMTIFQRLDEDNAIYNAVCVDNEPKFTEELFVKTSEEYLKVAKYFNSNATSAKTGEAEALFQNGQAAMIFDGTWSTAAMGNALGEKVGCFNLPGFDGPSKEFLMNYDEGYSIGVNTAHPELCIEFYEILFGQEMQAAFAEAGNLIACQNIEYDTSKVPAITNEVAALLATAESTNIPWDNPLGTNMGTEFNMTVQSILGGADPAQAFATLNDTAAFEWDY